MAGTTPPAGDRHGPIILFDAECVLCSVNAQFVLRHDTRGYFRLASMQGAAGAEIYRRHGMDPKDPVSLLVVDGGRVRQDSDAVLSIYEALGLPWRLLAVLRIIPAFLRDPVYRCVARNRYRWFGKRAQCWVAPPQYRDRIF
ncbi:DCC1-like thiol-disulfide oxidoreductase family protein [Rhizobium sp. UGM030330-04]|uniref:thiol-disulfide oxidoreductase DCC family protein n=1 Tax=Rhizobium sp. UGM030330-04 TaxID=1378077 RepID=UPI000D8DDD99|nr:DCC1-like thiol-disulfide oxidoreductase family protein [Rhizobium sp. UGM030330-04]PYG59540.1 putative DCC family thiol-disulfide oxidoreductase YuxK [Rhizobium sp. UGM030330-04]